MWIKTIVSGEETCINLSQYRTVKLQVIDQVWGGDEAGKGGRKMKVCRIWADSVMIYSSNMPDEAQEMFDRIMQVLNAKEIM